jgi:hypothetical protein
MKKQPNNVIFFASKKSIAYLDVETMELSRIDNVGANHFIFENIKAPFDWFFQDTIMIIPDPVPASRRNWNNVVRIYDQEILCKGKFIIFLHFEKMEGYDFATSLTLPEYNYIKNGISVMN